MARYMGSLKGSSEKLVTRQGTYNSGVRVSTSSRYGFAVSVDHGPRKVKDHNGVDTEGARVSVKLSGQDYERQVLDIYESGDAVRIRLNGREYIPAEENE